MGMAPTSSSVPMLRVPSPTRAMSSSSAMNSPFQSRLGQQPSPDGSPPVPTMSSQQNNNGSPINSVAVGGPDGRIVSRNTNGTFVTTQRPSNESELQLYRVLQRANLLSYYDTFISQGGDDLQQLCETSQDEFLEIMSLVGMASKPLHVRRFQKMLQEWYRSPGLFQTPLNSPFPPSSMASPSLPSTISSGIGLNIRTVPSPTFPPQVGGLCRPAETMAAIHLAPQHQLLQLPQSLFHGSPPQSSGQLLMPATMALLASQPPSGFLRALAPSPTPPGVQRLQSVETQPQRPPGTQSETVHISRSCSSSPQVMSPSSSGPPVAQQCPSTGSLASPFPAQHRSHSMERIGCPTTVPNSGDWAQSAGPPPLVYNGPYLGSPCPSASRDSCSYSPLSNAGSEGYQNPPSPLQLTPVLTEEQIQRLAASAEVLVKSLPAMDPKLRPGPSKKKICKDLEAILSKAEEDPRRMDAIRKYSAIYGRFDCKRKPEKPLTLHEVSVNEAAAQLCRLLPALLTRRDELFPMARRVVRESGYQYSKGHSRSQAANSRQLAETLSSGTVTSSDADLGEEMSSQHDFRVDSSSQPSSGASARIADESSSVEVENGSRSSRLSEGNENGRDDSVKDDAISPAATNGDRVITSNNNSETDEVCIDDDRLQTHQTHKQLGKKRSKPDGVLQENSRLVCASDHGNGQEPLSKTMDPSETLQNPSKMPKKGPSFGEAINSGEMRHKAPHSSLPSSTTTQIQQFHPGTNNISPFPTQALFLQSPLLSNQPVPPGLEQFLLAAASFNVHQHLQHLQPTQGHLQQQQMLMERALLQQMMEQNPEFQHNMNGCHPAASQQHQQQQSPPPLCRIKEEPKSP